MAYKTKSEIEEEYKRKIEKIRQEKAEAIGRATARDRKAETQAKIRIGGVVLKVLRESYEKHVEEEMATSGKSRADGSSYVSLHRRRTWLYSAHRRSYRADG